MYMNPWVIPVHPVKVQYLYLILLLDSSSAHFKGLSDTLETVNLDMDIRISDYDLSCELLKTLSKHCIKLVNLRFHLRFNHSRPLPIVKNCFKSLKKLIVPELKFVDALISDDNCLTKLLIEQATMEELRNFDLTTLGQKLKMLKKCFINVRPGRYTGTVHPWDIK